MTDTDRQRAIELIITDLNLEEKPFPDDNLVISVKDLVELMGKYNQQRPVEKEETKNICSKCGKMVELSYCSECFDEADSLKSCY